MFAKENVVVHREEAQGFHYAEIVSGFQLLYRTQLHADRQSLAGWVSDFQDALSDARCLWCGDPVEFVTEIVDLDVYGFCSERDYTEALRESEDMERAR